MPNRIIKESIWTSDTLSETSLLAQGFFFRLLPLPDDHGCFDARPAFLRTRMYPFQLEKVTEENIGCWLSELQAVDSIRFWLDAKGVLYGYIPGWKDHQTIRSIHNRKHPEPPPEILNSKTHVDFTCKQSQAVAYPNPNPNPNQIQKIPASGKKLPSPKEHDRNQKLEIVQEIANRYRITISEAEIFKLLNNGYKEPEVLAGALLLSWSSNPPVRELYPWLKTCLAKDPPGWFAKCRLRYQKFEQENPGSIMAVLGGKK
jgi:hypothetical protein